VASAIAGWVASAEKVRVMAIVSVTALMAAGFLSHFSTISVGVPLAGLAAVLLFAFGRGTTRRLGVWLLAATLAAAAISYVVYYSHFHEVYAKTLDRVAAREGEAATRSMVAPVSVKAARWLFETRVLFGVPVLLAAVAGAVWLLRRHARDGLTLIFAGWALTWMVFSALGIFTAVEMRNTLAAAPLLLALATFSLGALSRISRAGALAAGVIAIVIAWQGLGAWMSCLGR